MSLPSSHIKSHSFVKNPINQTTRHRILCSQPPLMDLEQLLNLFNSVWFEREIFNNHPFSSNPQNPQPENPLKNPPPPEEEEEEPFVRQIRTRSISEYLASKLSFMSNSNSPNSVLFSPKLQTMAGNESPENSQRGNERRPETELRMKWSESKSLSELEFEELKGFMDMGFVFTEEDKDSSLAWIVPALNRGRKEGEEEMGGEILRPYLSEAWEAMELRMPLMKKWRFPGNETDMKDNLKWWAHAVASTVR
ncbi:uncharacterized protein LOC111456711 [Cucurbita moschata]|uniref:Uncharacterized protein LOC111456711 n=1 Tax=Cucurbita moschata TaxID=3662 RepID=A0A6J1GR10_CUCMO|nr:uncharacterized protein LOC111456711 [Cucurbita moschata]